METIEGWSARPDVVGARLADGAMGAENRRIAPFGPRAGVELVMLEGIVQPFPLHFHDFWTVGQIVAGVRRMRCRGREHVLGPGDFVLFGPGEVHGCEPVGAAPLSYRSVVVPDGLFSLAAGEALGALDWTAGEGATEQPLCFARVVVRDEALAACMARLYELAALGAETDALAQDEALLELIAQTARHCAGGQASGGAVAREPEPVPPRAARRAVARARALVDARYEAGVSLDELAAAAGVSRYHLIRLFADETGLTPHRYLQAVRANRARDLLSAGTDPAEAAQRAGFSDQAHMTRVYKSFYGITPGRYRSAARPKLPGAR